MYDIINLLTNLNKKNVKRHGYRQARPKVYLVSFDREDIEIERLEKLLYEFTGERKDNHTLFEVRVNEYTLALQFSDDKMYLGLGVEKQPW